LPFLNLDPDDAEPIVESLGAPLVSQQETLLSLSNELLLTLGARTDVTADRLARWINQAYLDLPTSVDIPEFHVGIQFNTVLSQPLYLLPTTIIRTKRASMIDSVDFSSDGGTPLRKIDPDYYRKLPDQEDVVGMYFYSQKLIVLYPTPNAARTIVVDAYIRPQLLEDDTDSPIFAPEWYEALLLSARAKAFRSLLEWEAGATAENDFVAHVRRKINPQAEERSGMVAAFRPARSYRQLHGGRRSEPGDW
jgi:hypothetical protein